jgi:carnosine N-methyltransferase
VCQHTIYPYVHSLSNVPNRAAMLKRVQIPDVLPSDLPAGSNFSLVAGDFEEVYGQQDGGADPNEPSAGLWDAVLTCFFVDTVRVRLSRNSPPDAHSTSHRQKIS